MQDTYQRPTAVKGLYPRRRSDTVSTVQFRSKPLTGLSILLILVGALSTFHAPDDRDDTVVVLHHHTNHNEQLSSSGHALAPQEHCALCHWLRTLGDGSPVVAQFVGAPTTNLVVRSALLEYVQAGDRLALPSRAPPLG